MKLLLLLTVLLGLLGCEEERTEAPKAIQQSYPVDITPYSVELRPDHYYIYRRIGQKKVNGESHPINQTIKSLILATNETHPDGLPVLKRADLYYRGLGVINFVTSYITSDPANGYILYGDANDWIETPITLFPSPIVNATGTDYWMIGEKEVVRSYSVSDKIVTIEANGLLYKCYTISTIFEEGNKKGSRTYFYNPPVGVIKIEEDYADLDSHTMATWSLEETNITGEP